MTGTAGNAQKTNQRVSVEPSILDGHRVLVGDLVLDLAERTIYSTTNQVVKLSGNEFKILATLIKNAGRPVSRSDLMVVVTGSVDGAHHSAIDTYISFLRRRMQEADSAATIDRPNNDTYRLRP